MTPLLQIGRITNHMMECILIFIMTDITCDKVTLVLKIMRGGILPCQRDMVFLQELWDEGHAPWKTWA